MKVVLTAHSLARMKERYNSKDLSWMIETFKQALKMVKNNKLYAQHSYNNSLIIRWGDLKFVYSKADGEYILITVGRRCIEK